MFYGDSKHTTRIIPPCGFVSSCCSVIATDYIGSIIGEQSTSCIAVVASAIVALAVATNTDCNKNINQFARKV